MRLALLALDFHHEPAWGKANKVSPRRTSSDLDGDSCSLKRASSARYITVYHMQSLDARYIMGIYVIFKMLRFLLSISLFLLPTSCSQALRILDAWKSDAPTQP